MELKYHARDDCVAAWSNSKTHGELIACASLNPHNSSLSDLQILSVDLADPSKNLKVEGRSLYNSGYRCLAWGTFGEKQGRYPYGLIFGGMENGSFTLWNPAQMIGKNEQISESHIDEQNSFLYAEEGQQDAFPIMCAEWNSLKNNFLAFGSTSLLILDVSRDISSPSILKPTSPHQNTYITSVSWNKQVPHILASAGADGLIALYDLKSSRTIFSFRDNSTSPNPRNIEIAWSKHISTQIAVTLDDDKKNELQIWDLRNQKGPIVVIDKVHSRGINTMDWSELDHDLILTSSRDNQVVCWNYKQDQEPLMNRRSESQVTKVAWAKSLPSIYSVVSTSGLSIYSLDDSNIHSYIPKWLKVPASSIFNGNENLLTFQQQRGNNLHQYVIKPEIRKQLAQQIGVLQQFLQNQNFESLKQAEGETGQFWRLISTKKNQESDSDIYDFLGLNKDNIRKEVEKYTGKKRDSSTVNNSKSSKNKQKTKASKADYIPISSNDAIQIFTSLSQNNQPNLQNSFNKNEDDAETENVKYDMVPRNYNWDIGKQKIIKQNMLVGNYEGAIDAALKCGRTAEALIIAYSIDQTTFNSTLKTFFTETTDNFISNTLRYVAFKQTEELVKKHDLNKWKECIALIYSLSSAEKRKGLLSQLAKRLQSQQPQSEQHQQAAIYSFILAQQFEQILQAYTKKLNKQRSNSVSRKITLTILGTRLLAIYSSMTVTTKITQNFERIIKQLALVCLESNKKLLSYTLLTKYAPQSSPKYIDYLIFNTQELTQYRNNSSPIVSLPVMNKRQEKVKKSQRNQDQTPTNIKPSRQPKMPVKNAFNEPQNDVKTSKTKQVVPPPPPPGQHHQNPTRAIVPLPPPSSISQTKTKVLPPPPPPPPQQKKHQQQNDESDQTQQKEQYHPPAPPKKNVPPPPPPKGSGPKVLNTSFEQPSSKKKIPPPPPPPIHQKVIQKQQPVSVRPNNSLRVLPSMPTPPPPPPAKKQTYQAHEREEPVKRVIQPPAKNLTITPPPPPPPKSQPFISPPTTEVPRPLNVKPPSTKKIQQPEYQQEQQQEEIDQVEKKIVPPSRSNPIPPPLKKNNAPPPPPPKKIATRMQSQPVTNTQPKNQQQELVSSQQIQRRGPPPPPVRKVPRPPGQR